MSRGQPAVQSSAERRRVQGTSRSACGQQVRSQAGGGLAGLRQQIEFAATVLGDARATSSMVVVPTPTDPMVFRKSTRDVKARCAAKESTNETRGGGGGLGVGRPGDGLGPCSNS